MIERAGTCTALSVLIVIGATVILHRTEGVKHKTPPETKAKPPIVPVTSAPQPIAKPAPVEPNVKRPTSSLTTVQAGESFGDFARRVYGEAADLDKLWEFNRDQLPTKESQVHAGMNLRTPDL